MLTPTTRTYTRTNGATVQITEWTIGVYTLRKVVAPEYTSWTAITTADPHLPQVEYKDGDPHRPIFGVSDPVSDELCSTDALTFAKQITEATQAARTFNMIVAAN